MTTSASHLMNEYGSKEIPFLFIIDFEMKKPEVIRLDKIGDENIQCFVKDELIDFEHSHPDIYEETDIIIKKDVLSFDAYKRAFELVKNHLLIGNSFLTNLTAETPIELNADLKVIYHKAKAKYKLLFKDRFLCFSPETFVQIDHKGRISSFPMKGTIDAEIPGAEKKILEDKKEFFEHTTIVDLIRNDLSRVCDKVRVENFRYIDRISKEDGGELLQVSSRISGDLPASWKSTLGNILFGLLPAGSISGAPKSRTVEIIKEAEKFTYSKTPARGYYTGIFGIFDGRQLSSGVMIRYIENTSSGMVYKSGGGITSRSTAENEYKEMLQKIYVPIL